MKLEIIAATIAATALIMPTFAQDKPVTQAPKAAASNAQTNKPSKHHSHLEEKQGIKPSEQPAGESKPVDKSKHFHPRDR